MAALQAAAQDLDKFKVVQFSWQAARELFCRVCADPGERGLLAHAGSLHQERPEERGRFAWPAEGANHARSCFELTHLRPMYIQTMMSCH